MTLIIQPCWKPKRAPPPRISSGGLFHCHGAATEKAQAQIIAECTLDKGIMTIGLHMNWDRLALKKEISRPTSPGSWKEKGLIPYRKVD